MERLYHLNSSKEGETKTERKRCKNIFCSTFFFRILKNVNLPGPDPVTYRCVYEECKHGEGWFYSMCTLHPLYVFDTTCGTWQRKERGRKGRNRALTAQCSAILPSGGRSRSLQPHLARVYNIGAGKDELPSHQLTCRSPPNDSYSV